MTEDTRRPFTCARPDCCNLSLSSHRAARFCSRKCKDAVKMTRIGKRNPVHYGICACGRRFGGRYDEKWCKAHRGIGNWPVLGPTVDDWPMFGPTKVPAWSMTTCVSCGVTFGGGSWTRFCSERCMRNPIDDSDPQSCDVEYGECRRCSKPYARPAYLNSSGCCSGACAKRLRKSIEKRRYRALKRNQRHEPYTLREIADRDGWRCHLCGKKVPDGDYKARDRDPTIDHLIPQSAGGDDIKSNVALAHNRCNWERSDQGAAQLRLAG